MTRWATWFRIRTQVGRPPNKGPRVALTTALVDRARTVRQDPLLEKVGGKTRHVPVRGDWFKVRLQLPGGGEVGDGTPWSGRRVVREPSVLMGVKDLKGNPVALTVEDRLEIRSKQLGDAEWEVVTAPEPLRKKRRVIGYELTVRRVEVVVEGRVVA